MKLSENTISIMKNFGSIYESMVFNKGKVLKTISKSRDILAQCAITEEIPCDFAIYDVNNFLSVISLYKETPELSFTEKSVILSGLGGRSKMEYRFCPRDLVTSPPEKNISMPSSEVELALTKQDFAWIKNVSNIISTPNISVKSDGKKIKIVSYDSSDDASATNELEIADGNGDKYDLIFKTEALIKMYDSNYNVTISSKGVGHFVSTELDLQYWITTQPGSSFTKGE